METSEHTSQPGIIFTDAAARKVQELILEERNPDLKLRVYISGGGCSGFQYGFPSTKSGPKTISPSPRTGDSLVDPLSFVPWEPRWTIRKNLQGAQFVIRNPNAATTCGCGSSYSV
jgi:iron-sulfur cluster insertion protein